MAKKLKKSCCKSYRNKGKACRKCPLMARLDSVERERLVAAYRGKKRKKRKKRKKKKGGKGKKDGR